MQTNQPKKKRRHRRRRNRAASGDPANKSGQASAPPDQNSSAPQSPRLPPVYAAIDLGTNNCRLLVAKRTRDGFRVIDAYSRIVRLGEGLANSDQLNADAMDRALEALKVCSDKMQRRGVTRARSIATEACRTAANGPAFVERVKRETGIELDIVSTADEAGLAVAGCAPLLDPGHSAALVFDIGGGSTELMWVHHENRPKPEVKDWTSLPCGVVTLAEKYGGEFVSRELFEEMVSDVSQRLDAFRQRLVAHLPSESEYHLLGTSGTVTTITGVHLGLKRYDRAKVDGAWIGRREVSAVTDTLLGLSLAERAAHPCIGVERADLVLAGCAILEAINRAWPANRLRVADRGLREGILFSLMAADETVPRKRRRRRRRKGKSRSGSQAIQPSQGGEVQ
ncbi:MAG: hypothetical protein COA62_00020 [Rhodobiaceae bacterium]|nr:MAG: hypothetical protein COA62_00020 [Rhodobiaceae bacterium]